MKRQTWAQIKTQINPATRALLESEATRLSDELHLTQIRKARAVTQAAMAEPLGLIHVEVSKVQRRSDLNIGTHKKLTEAMNSELVLAARFVDCVEVPIKLTEPCVS